MKLRFRHHHDEERTLARVFPDQTGESARLIRRTVMIGCAVNLVLLILKLTAGYLGHSDALVADGFHSLNDVAADLIMLIFVGISYKAADDRYSYGYGKFETFSSFLMSAFLIVAAVVIAAEGIESIIDYAHGEELPRPDVWTFVVVIFAICSKECLYRFYSHVGRKAESHALIANAWHHRSDALASFATLVGVTFAHFFGPSFRILDPVASLFIALVIMVASVRMFAPAFAELMEKSLPFDQVSKAREVIASVPGVLKVESLRSRRNGHRLVFDVDIKIAPHSTVEQGAEISDAISEALKKAFCPHILLAVNTRA